MPGLRARAAGGDVAVDVCHGGLGSIRVLKHRRDGVTEYQSLTTGEKRQLNTEANHFFVREDEVDAALALMAKVAKVNAALVKAARKEGLTK